MNSYLRHCLLVSAAGSAAFAASCSDSGPAEITASREISEFEHAVRTDATSAQRFQFARPAPQMTQFEPPASAPAASGQPQLAWDAPEGWTEAPSSSMRDINFTFGAEGKGECYVSRLANTGGGVVENVNRWRAQIGQPALSEAEVGNLPKISVFDLPATYVTADGSFAGMGGGSVIEDARLLGAILTTPQGALFVKMTGPREEVIANEEKFAAFCASLRLE